MDCGSYGINPSLLVVRREVDHDLRALRNRSGNSDIEDYLDVRAATGTVRCAVDAGKGNIGDGEMHHIVEIILDVGHLIATTELEDSDRLTGCGSRREAVEGRRCGWRERRGGRPGGRGPGERPSKPPVGRAVHPLDDVTQPRRALRRPLVSAIRPGPGLVLA